MDFHSVMETFAEAWVAANTQTPLTEAAEAQVGSAAAVSAAAAAAATTGAPGGSSGPSIPIKCVIERHSSSSSSSTCGPLDAMSKPASADQDTSIASSVTSHLLGSGTPLSTSGPSGNLDRNSPIITGTPGPQSSPTGGGSGGPMVAEQNSFAIIPSGTLFSDVVRTALSRLGYSASEAVGAKGFIQLRNWKPLTFDQIIDSNEATVSDVLGDISSVVTLRIRLFRPKGNGAHDLKDKLLQILLAHSYSLLVNTDCPIDQRLLTTLCGKGPNRGAPADYDIPEDTRKKFDHWYLQQVFNHYRQVATLAAAQAQQQQAVSAVGAGHGTSAGLHSRAARTNGTPLPLSVDIDSHHHQHQHHQAHPMSMDRKPSASALLESLTCQNGSPNAAQSRGADVQFVRTRIRTSFDPELELPKLHKWFSENQHPSRAQIQGFVKELNSLESRRGRKPLDVNNVVYWFKNARAAHKRMELKFVNGDEQSPKNNGHGDSRGKGVSLNGHHRLGHQYQAEEGMSFQDGLEDENSSQYSQTLDLSMRAIKRRRSNSSSTNADCSPLNDRVHGDHQIGLGSGSAGDKEELTTGTHSDDEDGDDDGSDLEDKYYLATTGGAQLGHHHHLYHQGQGGGGHNGLGALNGNNGSSGLYGSGPYGFAGGSANSSLLGGSAHHLPDSPEGPDGRSRIRRSRTFIDPMTEVPRLEQWFTMNTHPTHSQIVRFTEELNALQYRQKFPKLEPKNIQFWFKNRRAKYKRLSLPVAPPSLGTLQHPVAVGTVKSEPDHQHTHHRPSPSPQTSSSSVTSTSSPLGHSGAPLVSPTGKAPQLSPGPPLPVECPQASPGAGGSEHGSPGPPEPPANSVTHPPNPSDWTPGDVRVAIVELLRELSQSHLAKLCGLPQSLLSNIANNKHGKYIGKKKAEDFATWYLDYRKANAVLEPKKIDGAAELNNDNPEAALSNLSLWPPGLEPPEDILAPQPPSSVSSACHALVTGSSGANFPSFSASSPSLSSSPCPSGSSGTAATATAGGGGSQQIRCFFHPQKEVPQLKGWFKSNQKPSPWMLSRYVDILNQSPLRQQERPKVTVIGLKNWWKNQKQKEKRTKSSSKRTRTEPTPDQEDSRSGDLEQEQEEEEEDEQFEEEENDQQRAAREERERESNDDSRTDS